MVQPMPNDQPAIDRAFQALADPARRTILDRLSLGPARVSDLAAPLPMSLSAVIQHIQVLEAAGLVRSEKRGRTRTCHLRGEVLRAAEDWLAERRRMWAGRLDRLDAHLGGPDLD